MATPRNEKDLQVEEESVLRPHDTSSLTAKETPSEDDLENLERVSGTVDWSFYTLGFVEFSERFSYSGTVAVFVNFIQQPLPVGSNTGAGFDGQSGALGKGQNVAAALTAFNGFWMNICPLLGAWIADEKLGRFKTIQWFILIAVIGHILLIISAIPPVVTQPDTSIAVFGLGLGIMGIGTGGFKANIAPLIAEQVDDSELKVVLKKGKRVLEDPNITISRVYMYFYLLANTGQVIGSIAMVYAEKYVGFWLSFLLPTVMFCTCPMVLFASRNIYKLSPPTGSVSSKAVRLLCFATKGRWSTNPISTFKNMKDMSFWENVKPSNLGDRAPNWMLGIDDAWVDEVRRGFKACAVFVWFPLYWLAFKLAMNNYTSQAATMALNGAPNDIITNIAPFTLMVAIPPIDYMLFPWLRYHRIAFKPIARIFTGFLIISVGLVAATVIQYKIYDLGPCPWAMNSCDDHAPVSVWYQTGPLVFSAVSEIFAVVTALEYAFTKAPKNMRSLVTALLLVTNAVGTGLTWAFIKFTEDPLLVWNYGSAAIIAGVGGLLFWLCHRKLDEEEDSLNELPESAFVGVVEEEVEMNVQRWDSAIGPIGQRNPEV